MKQCAVDTMTPEDEMDDSERDDAHARFLRGLSHELRTPLGSILILTELLEDGPDELQPRQLDKVRKIRQAAVELKGLVEHVSTLAKTVDGRLAAVSGTVDLQGLLEEVREQGEARARESGLTFELRTGNGLPPSLRTDRVILLQVLEHLLGHAFGATRQGGVTLAVDATAAGDVELALCDTGRGLPEELVPVAFEAFPAASFEVRRPAAGNALALPLAKALADLLGARLSLRSVDGEGSTVTLVLPAAASG